MSRSKVKGQGHQEQKTLCIPNTPAVLTEWNAVVADNVAQAANATSPSLVRGVFAGLRIVCVVGLSGYRWAQTGDNCNTEMFVKNQISPVKTKPTTTNGQSNLTKDRIAAADGRFNRIGQVAPMCLPVWSHWRHLANMIELLLPSAHPNPQPNRYKSIGSAVSAQTTTESPYTLQWAILTPKIAPSHGGIWTHLTHDSLCHPSPQRKRHLDRFSRFCTDDRR